MGIVSCGGFVVELSRYGFLSSTRKNLRYINKITLFAWISEWIIFFMICTISSFTKTKRLLGYSPVSVLETRLLKETAGKSFPP
jgi:hypothetical protein